MGCGETKDMPSLICIFEPQNDNQKNYCLRLRDNLHPTKPMRYEIKSRLNESYQIQLKIKGKIHTIENEYNESQFDNSLSNIYKLLGDTDEIAPDN
jgi:hypothetical protein